MKNLLSDKLLKNPILHKLIIAGFFLFLFLGYKNLWDINFGEVYFKEVSFSINISTKLFAAFVCLVIFYHLKEKIFFVLGVFLLLEFYYRFDVRNHFDCTGVLCSSDYLYPVINLYMIFFNYFLILILRLEKNKIVLNLFKISTIFFIFIFFISLISHSHFIYVINKVVYTAFIVFHIVGSCVALYFRQSSSIYYLLYVLTEIPSFLAIFYNINIFLDPGLHVPQWISHLRNFLLISGSFQRMNTLRQEFDQRKEIEIENIRLESQVLKNELNPHFLFNCLNNVDYFMLTDVPRAKKILNLVSTLYRDSLILSKETTIVLARELDFLEKYLKLEKMRYGRKLAYEFDIRVDINSVYIPSLIMQILVENSIKHGISRLKGTKGKILVSVFPQGKFLKCEISNSYEENLPPVPITTLSSKTGLENTKKRLEILYNGKSHFTYTKKEDTVVVSFEFSGEKI